MPTKLQMLMKSAKKMANQENAMENTLQVSSFVIDLFSQRIFQIAVFTADQYFT